MNVATWPRAGALLPGLAACALVAAAGALLSQWYGGPALLLALLLGFAMIPHGGRLTEPGVSLCAGPILRIGVALLGVRISLVEFQQVWAMPLTVVLITVPLILLLAVLGGRALGLPMLESLVAGVGVAICGVAAAMAVAAALPRERLDPRRLVGVAVSIPALGTAALVIYPSLATALGFNDSQAGILLGATIHDVGQGAASGYLISENAGHLSTLTKLMRVTLLVPLVFVVGLVFRRGDSEPAPRPLFLFGFVALMGLNSLGLLAPWLRRVLEQASSGCLLLTMAALGARTSVRQLLAQGWRPVLLLTGLSVILLAAAAALVALLPALYSLPRTGL